MARRIALTIVWIYLAVPALFPQETGNTPRGLALPAGNGSWVIRVFTSGGFSGTGSGNIAISSKGEIVCTMEKPACPKNFEVERIQRLVDKLAGSKLTATVINPSPAAPG